jgi:phosphoribosylanthranilate isomerase
MKERSSKLDKFETDLLGFDDARHTLERMQGWLRGRGVEVSLGRLSVYLEAARQRKLQARLLTRITSGARQCAQVEKKFGQNPAPEIETLIKLHRVLILQLSTQATADPSMIRQADQMMRTVMEYVSGRTKADLERQKLSLAERRVKLLEQKAAAFDKVKAAAAGGGVTAQTLEKIERELKLL